MDIEDIKSLVRLEEIVAETHPLDKQRGRYLRSREHDSLVIDTKKQYYVWNSASETGDVITWLMKRKGCDFRSAVDEICRRAGKEAPKWSDGDQATRMAARLREEVLDVAMGVFRKWLQKSKDALDYLYGRGLTDETIEREGLGFSGVGSDEERQAMRLAFRTAGVDMNCPPATAILGMKGGDIGKWGRERGLDISDWAERGYIPGMVGGERIVYPHNRMGRVVYLSGRSIREKKHYNLVETLVGGKQPYFNHEYSYDGEIVIVVEGQMDAITLGQWGFGAVALAGVYAEEGMEKRLAQHGIFVGLDGDEAGRRNGRKVAEIFGPMTKLVDWGAIGEQVKDANDLLQTWTRAGVTAQAQEERVATAVMEAPRLVEMACREAGNPINGDRDTAQRLALAQILKMDELSLAQHRSNLAKLMGVNLRDLTHMLKTAKAVAAEAKSDGEPVFTLGGVIDGYLVEYCYDPDEHRSSLAWKSPEGKIGHGIELKIGGVKYMPEPPTQTYKDYGVMFPSGLGALKSTKELVTYIEMFLKSVYLMPNNLMAKIVSYYALLTWIYDAFNTIPYLRVMGEAGAGKSEMMRRMGLVCYRLMSANGAGTASSLFRSVERYRGTVFIDEADLTNSDTTSDIIKFLNLGAMKGNPIWRMEEAIDGSGRKVYTERTFITFCPKLISMRKEFRDDAVSSRAITFKVQPRETSELVAAKVPLEITNDIRARAAALRNMLLRWRLEHWLPEIEIDPAYYDFDISSRLNQVTGPLMAVAKDDPELQSEMRRFLREYYGELVLSRSMTITARVVEALWKIHQYPDLRQTMVLLDGEDEKILIGNVAKITNQIINMMNMEEDDGDDKPKKRKDEVSPQRVGRIVREELQLRVTERTKLGYYAIWDQVRMEAVAKRWGVDAQNLPEVKAEAVDLKQNSLVKE